MSKRVKKETLPFIVAILMLFLLIGALVYTIMYKPKDNKKTISESTLQLEDVLINNNSTICGNYDVIKLSEDAKKVTLSYEVIDNMSYGKTTIIDGGSQDEEITYGYGLRIKVKDLTDDMYIRVINKTQNTTTDYYKNDIDNKGFLFEDSYNLDLQYLDVKVLINNDECKNIVLRNFETVLPRFNELLRGGLCTTDEYKDREICTPYIFNTDSYDTQLDKLNQEKEIVEKEKKEDNQKQEKIEKNKKWIRLIVIACILIVIAVASVVVMKGSKKHEKK